MKIPRLEKARNFELTLVTSPVRRRICAIGRPREKLKILDVRRLKSFRPLNKCLRWKRTRQMTRSAPRYLTCTTSPFHVSSETSVRRSCRAHLFDKVRKEKLTKFDPILGSSRQPSNVRRTGDPFLADRFA